MKPNFRTRKWHPTQNYFAIVLNIENFEATFLSFMTTTEVRTGKFWITLMYSRRDDIEVHNESAIELD